MPTAIRKPSAPKPTPQKRAAEKAEEVANVLHSFASALHSLEDTTPKTARPTPRNWWKSQAGRFKADPTFAGFVAQVQATRKREG